MKSTLPSSTFAFLLTALLCGPALLIASNKPETLHKQQNSKTGFIENKGQIIDQNQNPKPSVFYLLNTPGMNVQLRASGWSYDLFQLTSPPAPLLKERGENNTQSSLLLQEKGLRDEVHQLQIIQYHRIDFDLQNFNPDYTVETSEPSHDYQNYYTPGTPEKGVTFVHQFRTVTYKNIYQNIDLEFIANKKNGFKYNFVIRPGGDVSAIRMKITGPEIELSSTGSLYLQTSLGTVEENIPDCSFKQNDVETHIKCIFIRISQDVFGVSPQTDIPYNSVLTIDPIPQRLWGTYFGGTNDDDCRSISTDADSNAIICGITSSNNYIATVGAYQTTLQYAVNAFLAKFNTNGAIIWSTYYGGFATEGFSCATDHANNIFLAGETDSQTLISTPGSWQPNYAGGNPDCFLVKFTPAGQRVWGTYYGGTGADHAVYCAVDSMANIVLTGNTTSNNGIATPGAFKTYKSGFADAFLAKFDSTGSTLLWGTYYGGSDIDGGGSIAIDTNMNIYLAGGTGSADNISTTGSYQEIYGGGEQDGFLVKFSPSGQRIWGTYYGGTLADYLNWDGISKHSELYLYGTSYSTNGISTPGSYQPALHGPADAFLAKFDTNGNRVWGTYFGGSSTEAAGGAAINDSGFIYINGDTQSSDLIATPDAFLFNYIAGDYCFIAKFSPAGERLWGTYFGDTLQTGGMSGNLKTVGNNILYLAGVTTDLLSYCATTGAYQEHNRGGPAWGDPYLEKFFDCRTPDTARQINGSLNVCKYDTGIVYSVSLISYASGYHWIVPPGFQVMGGQNTHTLTIKILTNAVSGYISVYGTNYCGNGVSDSIFVTVNSFTAPIITGSDTVCQNSQTTYTTLSGMTNYQWSVSAGGTVVIGGTLASDFVTIHWTSTGANWVKVNFSNSFGCSDTLPVIKNIWVVQSLAVGIVITVTEDTVCAGTSVTFTATPTNQGANPFYQWKVNGVNRGINNSSYSYVPSNGDIVTCVLTSNAACATGNPATSNSVLMTVNPNLAVSVTISPDLSVVCQGQTITFTATPTHGGTNPSYQWYLNSNPAGTNSNTYTFTPVNSDLVSCTMTSSETCTSNNPASSIQHQVSVTPIIPVSITITPDQNPVCAGQTITFTATPINGGLTPSYQWYLNSNPAGINSNIFSFIPSNGDLVYCTLTSSENCTSNNPASSIQHPVSVSTGPPAGVSINAVSNPFCPGSSVTITATPGNGGPLPTYQWKVNGINTGTGSTYTYNPVNNDSVRCVMTSNLSCVTGNPASSNKIIMSGTLAPIVTFTSCFDTITTINAKPIKLKGGIPLGGTYSGPGVNSLTGIYTPSLAGTGTHTITYSYTNAALCTAAKSISILNLPSTILACGNPLTDVRDNKIYQTVQIGIQCWLATNLNFGTTIASPQDQRDNCISEKYCYNDNPLNCTNHGGLYQWDEVMRFDETPADQGFCPPGWHIPTENDWNILFATFINNGFAGSPLKYSGYSGFNALLSGARHINKGWDFQGFATFFWSSTPRSDNKAWAHGMNDADPSVSVYPASRVNAFSVRCIKD